MIASNPIQHLDDSQIRRVYEDLSKKRSKFPLSFLTAPVTPFQITGKHIRFVRHKVYNDMSEPKFVELLQDETGLSDISTLMLRRCEAYRKHDAKRPHPPSPAIREFIVVVFQNLQNKVMLEKLRKQLESLHEENLSKEWKSYLKEMLPQDRAISNAGEVLEELKHFDSLLDSSRLDCKVLPSANGGVGVCFFNGSIYADIECFNAGEVLAVIDETSSQDDPEVWEITDLNQKKFRESLARISERMV